MVKRFYSGVGKMDVKRKLKKGVVIPCNERLWVKCVKTCEKQNYPDAVKKKQLNSKN